MVSLDLFKAGMRRLASGVSLVTTITAKGDRRGMLATSVTSVSAEPASILVCVNKSASCHDHIRISGAFCVNLLGEGDDQLARQFSSSELRDVRFAVGEWRVLETGAPALASALVSFDCRVMSALTVGSHTVYIAEVLGVALWNNRRSPLLYIEGSFARLAGESCSTPSLDA